MSGLVYIHDEDVTGEVMSQMAYGAIIRYVSGGIEYFELMDNEDFEVLYTLDEVMEEFGID